MRVGLPVLIGCLVAATVCDAATTAEQLLACRHAHAWSRQSAGAQVGVSASTWGRWERGTTAPKPSQRARLEQMGCLAVVLEPPRPSQAVCIGKCAFDAMRVPECRNLVSVTDPAVTACVPAEFASTNTETGREERAWDIWLPQPLVATPTVTIAGPGHLMLETACKKVAECVWDCPQVLDPVRCPRP